VVSVTPPAQDRDHDVVVFGATGFVGRLTAAYLAQAAPQGVRIALAGRSQRKLEETRAALGAVASGWPLVAADSLDPAAMARLAASTRAVATTVGPYQQYGLPLVDACADAGTHYADLTGEVLFMRSSIDAAHSRAQASGARIVHTCGFDSIPSDLGVLMLHEAAAAAGAGSLEQTSYVVRAVKGGVSGGTVASLAGQVALARGDRAARRVLLDPYGLSPDRAAEPDLGDERDAAGPVRDEELGGWLAPFFMGAVNTRVVRRSNALLGYAYGRALRYRELMLMGGLPLGPVKATAVSAGLGALVAGLAFPPTRLLIDKVLPDPGEGPDEQARSNGFFKIDVHTRTSEGARLVCRVEAQGDPGYAATAVMLGESALCLALDEERLPDIAGVLTPATAMGATLADRLRAAGQTYDVG